MFRNKIGNMKKKRTMSCKIMKRKLFNVKYIHPGIYKQFKYTTKLGKNKIKIYVDGKETKIKNDNK